MAKNMPPTSCFYLCCQIAVYSRTVLRDLPWTEDLGLHLGEVDLALQVRSKC